MVGANGNEHAVNTAPRHTAEAKALMAAVAEQRPLVDEKAPLLPKM